MPGITQKGFHLTIRGPASEALDILVPHSNEILKVWRKRLRELDLDANVLVPGGIDFAALARRIRGSSYAAFREYVQNFGRKLAERCPQVDRAAAAFNRLFEICLPYLAAHDSRRASPVLALSRLNMLAGILVVSGYSGQWADGKQTMVEASMAENEERQREALTYITKIYEQERRRLARDLHDEVGHDLILIKLYLEMLVMDAKDYPAIQPRLAEAIALASHAIDAVRRLGLDLGPAIFDDLDFIPAVRSYINQFSARTKIQVSLRQGYVPDDIPMSHQVALYRLLQGALSNVLQHSAARRVTVSLGSMKDSVLIMVIEDDGVGFDVKARTGNGSFGLTAMRERVEILGGRIHIESWRATAPSRTHGTRIEVDLPLPGGGRN
jgi:signal transduction histidine kinase